jgi:hypothetical protein
MRLTAKTLGTLAIVSLLGLSAGTLAWELAERLLSHVGVGLQVGLGPLGFDLHAITLWVRLNPGSALGVGGAALLFRAL